MAEKLGKYEVVRELGRGGMGVVYEGRDPATNERAAIKVLPPQLALDPVFRQRFIREVKTLERLDHPNIVHIRDSGHQEGSLWYAMDFIEGTDLEHVVHKEGRLDPLRMTRIVQGVATALAYSHAQNIVHRDIKPANIMLAADDQVRLTDFGIARMVDATRMTATAGVLGTVEYMSPEQADGVVVDDRTDIYSLGVVYYLGVTGHMPIEGSNPTEIMVRIKTAQVDAPISWAPDLPRNVNDLILKMVEKDRSRRVLSAQALLRDLARVTRQLEAKAAGYEVAEEAVLTGGPAHAPVWRNPWLIALVVVALGLAGWRVLRRPPAPSAVIEQAAMLTQTEEYEDALGLLDGLLRREGLSAEDRDRAKAQREQTETLARVSNVGSRLWQMAKWAKAQKNLRLELKLILLIFEEAPGTRYARDAQERLKDSLKLQELYRELRPAAAATGPAEATRPAKRPEAGPAAPAE